MQLISTKQYHRPSIGYRKWPISVYQVESVTEPTQRQIQYGPIVLSIEDLRRESEVETSVFLKPKKDIELLTMMYVFKDPVEVKKFLWTHKDLIETLFEAYKQIKRVFRENIVDICLEYDRDPEEDFEGLFAIIKTNLSPEESLDILDRFDEEWFLDNVSNEIGSIFTVTVRPV